MARAKLTALAVETNLAKTGRNSVRVNLVARSVAELYLRKQTRDGASWTLRYRFGNYPDMSLAQARISTAANDLLRFTRRIFAFGLRRRFVPNNPAADFSPRSSRA